MATPQRSKRVPAGQDNDLALIDAAGYVRCSTDQQVEASIPAQKAAIRQWASANGYSIIAWYEDAGISGWKESREAFQRLIDDAEKRKNFKAIVVWDQNRFSRFPPVEACYYWHRLDQAGVHLASVNQNGRIDWNSIAGFLTATIRQHADSEHRHKLSADVTRGLRRVAESGRWLGTIPTGYSLGEDGRLVPNGQADLVRRIFRDYVAGHSLRGIAKQLNLEGHPSPTGKEWGSTTLMNMLSNRAYIGTFVGCHGAVEIPNHHPPLIDMPTWEAVQERRSMRQKQTTPLPGGGPYVLTGLVRCGKCGSPMFGRSGSIGKPAYICRRHDRTALCDRNSTPQAELVDAVATTIEEHWMDRRTRDRIRAAVRELIETEAPQAEPKQLEKELATVARKLGKAKQRLLEVDRDMLPIVQDSIRELKARQVQLEAAVKAANLPRGALLETIDERMESVVQRFGQLRQALARADVPMQRDILHQTVKKVEVWSRKTGDNKRAPWLLEHGRIHLRGDNEQLAQMTQFI